MTIKSSTPLETLHKLINKAKKRNDTVIRPESTFKDLGIDSLEAVNIIIALEDELGIDIEDSELKNMQNMGAFVRYLDKNVRQKRQPVGG
jgi:acyl carrier protein